MLVGVGYSVGMNYLHPLISDGVSIQTINRTSLHLFVFECVWDEDNMGEFDLSFNFISLEGGK